MISTHNILSNLIQAMPVEEHCEASIADTKAAKTVADLKLLLIKYSKQCLLKSFPPLSFYEKLQTLELVEVGVFINTSAVISNHERVIIVGKSVCSITLEPYCFCHLFMQHGAKAIISGGAYSRFIIHKSEDSIVDDSNLNKSTILWLP